MSAVPSDGAGHVVNRSERMIEVALPSDAVGIVWAHRWHPTGRQVRCADVHWFHHAFELEAGPKDVARMANIDQLDAAHGCVATRPDNESDTTPSVSRVASRAYRLEHRVVSGCRVRWPAGLPSRFQV